MCYNPDARDGDIIALSNQLFTSENFLANTASSCPSFLVPSSRSYHLKAQWELHNRLGGLMEDGKQCISSWKRRRRAHRSAHRSFHQNKRDKRVSLTRSWGLIPPAREPQQFATTRDRSSPFVTFVTCLISSPQ